MKKLFLLLPVILLAVSCKPEANDFLPAIPEGSLKASLNSSNSGLTKDESTSELQVALVVADSTQTYSVKIGVPCYIHTSFPEIVMKSGAYFKSVSEYRVDRLIVDFFGSKGVFFDVYANKEGTGATVGYYKSTVTSSDVEGGGMVYEYPINSTGWIIKNNTENNKPGFYSVTVVFSV